MLLWTNVSLFRCSGRLIGIPYLNIAFPWITCGLHLFAVLFWLLRINSNLTPSLNMHISTGPMLSIAAAVALCLSALVFTIDYCRSGKDTVKIEAELSIQTS